MNNIQAKKLLDTTFNNKYDTDRFLRLLKELFNKSNLKSQDVSTFVANQFREYILNVSKLGQYKDAQGKTIELLAIKLANHSSLERARSMQRNFIAKWLTNNPAEPEGALVAFYDAEDDWRFSFVKLEYNLITDEKGNLKTKKELTPAKRYSFLVGPNEPNHTCQKQFVDLLVDADNPLFEEIEDAFSIEKVTKEFFEEYKKRYLDLKESLEKVIEKDSRVKEEFIRIVGSENEDFKTFIVEFSKKLLGQIVFLYFLQKKGWLGVGIHDEWGSGPKDFIRRLFGGGKKQYKPLKEYNNFFNDILEYLFYEALAKKRDGDYYGYLKCKIPFLNGGLFEPLDGYSWESTDITIDDDIFEKILTTFDTFNFTIKEDEPLEKEVAVDPEMLGKVFENLLEVTDRKSKGAFYTPREIVHYMCQQSLINYLETNTDLPKEDIEKFIQEGDKYLDQTIKSLEHKKKYAGKTYNIDTEFLIPEAIEKNYEQIDTLLQNIKVVDPAVGSGAFPIGMMNEIVKARSILSIYYTDEREISELKRACIENSLYGVDIMPSAVDICQLRFWLSLVVDETDKEKVRPLPNLDNKIMCGNSLLEEFEGIKLFDENFLGDIQERDYIAEIRALQSEQNVLLKQNLSEEEYNKSYKKLSREINLLEKEARKDKGSKQITLAQAYQLKINESSSKIKELRLLQREFFNEYERDKKKLLQKKIEKIEWDLIELTLKGQGNENSLEKLEKIKKSKSKPFFLWRLYFPEVFQRENSGFDVVIGNPPYVNIFNIKDKEYRANLVKNFAVSKNKTDLYAFFVEKGNSLLRQKGSLAFIISNSWLGTDSFSKFREFLINKTCVKTLVKCPPGVFDEATVTVVILILSKSEIENNDVQLLEFNNKRFSTFDHVLSYETIKNNVAYGFTFNKEIIFETETEPLGDTVLFSLGIKTSNDKRFVSEEKKDDDSYKLLRGKDVLKYFSAYKNKWIWYRPDLMLEKVGAGPRKLEYFLKEKIIIKDVANHIQATLDRDNFLTTDTLTLLYETKKHDFRVLLAILNSKLINAWFKMNFDAGLHIKINQLKNIPIPIIIPCQNEIVVLVDALLKITSEIDFLSNEEKQQKSRLLEEQIDELIFDLYKLSCEDKKIVIDFYNLLVKK